MVFSNLIFIYVFLPIFFLIYFIAKKRNTRNAILLIFSLLFYAYGEPLYSLLMIFSIIINYFLAILINKYKSKFIFILTIIINLSILGLFKYYNFFIDSFNSIFNSNIRTLSLVLPIGISFYTFQIITYIVDVYKGKCPVQKNIISLGCYITMFPQLIAGPIVRYETVNKELNDRCENIDDISNGIRRFIIGLSKKVLIANSVSYIYESVYKLGIIDIGFIGILIVAISYTIQIYFDFSGYSDMAIGLGKILGFNYEENFNYPYIATSITDFWRRWHMSLSTFFRDYVYIPLGGNRKGVKRQIINLLIVWTLTGLWHGASYNFIIWGLYYGILLILEKFVLNKIINKLPNIVKHLYTLIIVLIGWIIFLSPDINSLISSIRSLIGLNGIGNIKLISKTQIFTVRYIIPFILGIIFSGPVINKFKNIKVKDILIFILLVISTMMLLVDSYNPFIYFRF